MKIIDTAKLVQRVLEPRKANITITDAYDQRDYHISSEKIKRVLGFEPEYTVEDMVRALVLAFDRGAFPDVEDDVYYNIRKMKVEQFGKVHG